MHVLIGESESKRDLSGEEQGIARQWESSQDTPMPIIVDCSLINFFWVKRMLLCLQRNF